MFREPFVSASRRLATSPCTKSQSHTTSLLAALDSLDLNGTTANEPKVDAVEVGSKVVERAGNQDRKKTSVERLKTRAEVLGYSYVQMSKTSSGQLVSLASTEKNRKQGKGTRRVQTQAQVSPESPSIIPLDAGKAPILETLPVYSYKDYKAPKAYLVYTRNEEEANDLIAGLKPGPLAMDLEWPVDFFSRHGTNFNARSERKVAVVQIADGAGLILVIQINKMRRLPIRLQALIENADVAKVGVNILNDGKKLFRDYGIRAKNLVELGAVALAVDSSRVFNRRIVSLARLVGHYCRRTLLKGNERTSNWEELLSLEQQEYAANDVHSSLMVYNELMKLSELQPSRVHDPTQYTSEVTWPLNVNPISGLGLQNPSKEGMRPQFLRAYKYWHQEKLTLDNMCLKLSLKDKGFYGPIQQGESIALQPGTVISYVISALQNDPELEFQLNKLVELVQMDLNSWSRHSFWITKQYFLK